MSNRRADSFILLAAWHRQRRASRFGRVVPLGRNRLAELFLSSSRGISQTAESRGGVELLRVRTAGNVADFDLPTRRSVVVRHQDIIGDVLPICVGGARSCANCSLDYFSSVAINQRWGQTNPSTDISAVLGDVLAATVGFVVDCSLRPCVRVGCGRPRHTRSDFAMVGSIDLPCPPHDAAVPTADRMGNALCSAVVAAIGPADLCRPARRLLFRLDCCRQPHVIRLRASWIPLRPHELLLLEGIALSSDLG